MGGKDDLDIKALAGKIRLIVFDFDGVFTDNRVLTLQDGTEGVFCSRSDGLGIEMLRKANVVDLLVLSKEENPVVGARCRKLKVRCIQGCDNKLERLKSEAREMGLGLDEIAYMGNDVNDLECLQNVGLPVCVKDSYPEVLEASVYVTAAKGGKGAVREFCDIVRAAKTGV